jgi:hypothetical protein
MNLNLKKTAIGLFLTLAFCQCKEDRNPAGQAYYSNLKNTLDKVYHVSIGGGDNINIFILHSDTICSCNGKNVYLVDEIAKKDPRCKTVVILKNDYRHNIRDFIHTKNAIFCSDSTRILEKDGNVFRFDKIFAVRNGSYDNMFDLEDKDVPQIQRYFNL